VRTVFYGSYHIGLYFTNAKIYAAVNQHFLLSKNTHMLKTVEVGTGGRRRAVPAHTASCDFGTCRRDVTSMLEYGNVMGIANW
jgi:hypothetical protein